MAKQKRPAKRQHEAQMGSRRHRGSKQAGAAGTSWEPLAGWYDGWMGKRGSRHHQELVIPTVRALLAPTAGERVLDVGAGQGVCAPCIAGAGAAYVGVDASPALIRRARRYHGQLGQFLVGDARRLADVPALAAGSFDGVLFALSIQDMDPLEQVLASAAWALKPGGRMVMILSHPCFRVPRQSGWEWDARRKLQVRRVDRYLTPLTVPLKPPSAPPGATSLSFHRPLQCYINGLAACGLMVDRMMEVPGTVQIGHQDRPNAANPDIPLLLGLRAWLWG